MKKSKPKILKKALIWGGAIGAGFLVYQWAKKVPTQFSVGKLKFVTHEDGKLFFELPIINDSILSPELKDFQNGVLAVDGRELGKCYAEPIVIQKKATTILKLSCEYELGNIFTEVLHIATHGWGDKEARLTGTLVIKEFISYRYPLDLKLK